MIILICLFFLIISLVISRRFAGTMATPLGIFGSVWNGLLILFELRLVAYSSISTSAYLLLTGSYAAFLLGATTILFGSRVIKRSKHLPKVAVPVYSLRTLTTLEHFIWFFTAVSAVGFVAWTIRVLTAGGRSALYSINYRAMEIEPMAGGMVGHMLALGLSGALLAGIYISYGGKQKIKVFLSILPLVGYCVISGSRVTLIWALLFLSCPLLIRFGQRKQIYTRFLYYKRHFILLGLALFIAFIVIGNGRSVDPVGTRFQYYTNAEMPSALTHVYVYLTGSFAAFSNLLATQEHDNMPFSKTFTPFLKTYDLFASPKSSNITYQMHYPSTYIPFDFNTYTYLADLYLDFGLLGVVIAPYGLGLISTYLASKNIYRHPIAYLWASFLCTFLIFSFAVSLTAKVEPWTAMIGAMVGLYIAFISKKKNYFDILDSEEGRHSF